MRRPLGVLAAVASLAACSPSVSRPPVEAAGAVPEVTAPTSTPAQTRKPAPRPAAESDECRVSVVRPNISALRIQTAAARRGCVHPALLRVQVKRAVPGTDPVVKSGATRKNRIALRLPCKQGTYYAVATDYRGGTARSNAVRLTCVTPSPTTRKTETPATPERKASITSVGTSLENEVVRLTNAERAKGGCKPLKHDARLRKAAFGHSADMAKNDYFDHDSQDGRDMVDRMRAAGFTGSAWAENIAMGQRSAAEVVRTWMNSDGHRQNIMNCSYTLIGVGAAKDAQGQLYWTQDFAAR
ncbi:CAP domain-containing protein [Nonomuraea guangzhouensis]|uniref:CAP domain-containing protein n=1 Tax=Nonomuraea guangzhouensis TaxID=1291555 RepID=A0ABW4FZD5_9ACTN|nr:CAP domain-containing protein [Nonomuraea guangzhouensis]